jgi:hypothetical protein
MVFRHCRCVSFIKKLRIKKGNDIKIHSAAKRIIELLKKCNQKLLVRLHKYRWGFPVNSDRLKAPKNQNAGSQSMTEEQFAEILNAYAAGNISRRGVEEVTGLWFGDILAELGCRGLQLPLFDSRALLNEKQLALYNTIFSKQPPEHGV